MTNPLIEAQKAILKRVQTSTVKPTELPKRLVGSDVHENGNLNIKNTSRSHYTSSNTNDFSSGGDVKIAKKAGFHASVKCNETGNIKYHLKTRAHYSVESDSAGDLNRRNRSGAHHSTKDS